jgi:23S rRNA (cytidine1920-2'-O)/16S rRNA (cytidine1409-2'-O)-methyltransferase
LATLPTPPIVTIVDVSFISLRAVLPHICALLRVDADIVALLKPQFETETIKAEESSSIRHAKTQRRIRDAFAEWCKEHRLVICNELASPLRGKRGIREVFVHLRRM